MSLLQTFKNVLGALSGREDVELVEEWAEDENAFQEHFGQSYSHFNDILSRLDKAHFDLYKKTLETNAEAAVCWVFFIAD